MKPLVDLNKGVKCSSSTLLWSVGWWQVGGRAASASSVSRSNIICPQWEVNENWGEPATELVWRVEGKFIFKYTWFWSADLSDLSAFKHLVSKLKDQKSDVMNLVGWFDVWSVGWNPVHDLIITCNTFFKTIRLCVPEGEQLMVKHNKACWMNGSWLVGSSAGLHKFYWTDLNQTWMEVGSRSQNRPLKLLVQIQIKRWIQGLFTHFH